MTETLGISCELGESPVWSAEQGTLAWVDIKGRRVHRLRLHDRRHESWAMPTEPGCVALARGGGLVVALRSGFHLLDTTSGALTLLAGAEYDQSRLRFNDGRCDPAGRFWAGTMQEVGEGQEAGLWCLDAQAKSHRGPHGIALSNGLAFSPDGRWMYHADSRQGRVFRHAYDPATGQPGPRETWIEIPAEEGVPDGAAVDADGAYWVALYGGGELRRYSQAGELLDRVPVPVRAPTMPAFGGPDLRTLFVTSARAERDAEELAAHPLSGQVLMLRVQVPGRPEPHYAG